MKPFAELWDFIVTRSRESNMPVVQNKVELEYIFNLMKGCESYLEIGTAEGNSLYVLSHALPKESNVAYVDLGEKHTKDKRQFILDRLTDYKVTSVLADSNDLTTAKLFDGVKYDAVMIDAGHDAINVAIDALFYGPLATKFIFFHDIQLPEVERAFDWYCRQRPDCQNYRIVNSENYGYGIMEIQ